MDRPPADPAKLLSSLGEWEVGETPPGRVVSNLKTGGLRDLLEHAATAEGTPEASDPTEALAAWMEWESGQTPPAAVMTRLHECGLRPLLEALAGDAATADLSEG